MWILYPRPNAYVNIILAGNVSRTTPCVPIAKKRFATACIPLKPKEKRVTNANLSDFRHVDGASKARPFLRLGCSEGYDGNAGRQGCVALLTISDLPIAPEDHTRSPALL